MIPLISQGQKPKFGKVEKRDLEINKYEKDTTAEAVVLSDYGKSYFYYSPGKQYFELYFDRHLRIKILKKSGYEWATIQIPYYVSAKTTGKEQVSSIKGLTFNIENGEVEKQKLEKKGIFDEKRSENWRIKKLK